MNKTISRMSAARRSAEAILSQSQKRQESFKREQQQASDALAEKTARLRELRLAKEAADREAEAAVAAAAPKPKKRAAVRRSKQT
ncbi:MAG: hypothetical protein ACTSRM_08920 [Alphaproteobacteria bacterium]|jgi:hypothetical protein|uniref:hypothetical protein n=1 Tax=Methyloceanibacter sp. TaxID=1965321 RepID=UPI0035622279